MNALKQAPVEIREVVERAIKDGRTPRMAELEEIRDCYAGGQAALSERYHPTNKRFSAEIQARLRRLRKHINLVSPAVKFLIGNVYGGITRRTIRTNPYSDRLQPFVDSYNYRQKTVTLTRLAYLYGTAAAVPLVSDSGRLSLWLPNPVYTVIAANAHDIEDREWLYELTFGASTSEIRTVRFAVKGYYGYYDKANDRLVYSPSASNVLPVTIAYGDSRESEGYLYGESLVRPCVDASWDVTHGELMIGLLRDLQSSNLLAVWGSPLATGDDDQQSDLQQMVSFGVDEQGRKLGDIEFKSPPTKLSEVIEQVNHRLEVLSSQTGIPLDVFRPALISGSDASAQSARVRQLPLQQTATLRLEQAKHVESQLVESLTIALTYHDADSDIDVDALRDSIETEIVLQPEEPISMAEEVASTIQLVNEGMMYREDGIRKFSPHLTPEQVTQLAASRNNADPA